MIQLELAEWKEIEANARNAIKEGLKVQKTGEAILHQAEIQITDIFGGETERDRIERIKEEMKSEHKEKTDKTPLKVKKQDKV